MVQVEEHGINSLPEGAVDLVDLRKLPVVLVLKKTRKPHLLGAQNVEQHWSHKTLLVSQGSRAEHIQ